jgi:catechol 2,3-dioxygenase-like lactoylglutathione lyase family enzyme
MSALTHASPVCFILTADLAASTTFYQDVLDLKPGTHDDFGNVFWLDDITLRITTIPGFKAGEHPVLGWAVPDIVATVQRLNDRGVFMTIYEGFGQDAMGIWTSPDGSAKVTWFKDPDGNVLSLTQS